MVWIMSTGAVAPASPFALDETVCAHLGHAGPLARVTSQEKGSAMTNRVHVFGFAGNVITRAGSSR